TFLLREIVTELRRLGFNVHVLASTAMAANIAQGSTFMSFFGLNFDSEHGKAMDNSFFRCPTTLSSRMLEGLRRTGRMSSLQGNCVVVFDELTTVLDTAFCATDMVMREIRNEGSDKPFGGAGILVAGDGLQLRGAEPERYGRYSKLDVKPIWECSLWSSLRIETYYLDTFNRGEHTSHRDQRPGRRGRRALPYQGDGLDENYLNLLKEMRNWSPTNLSPLSEDSKGVLSKIIDEEGQADAKLS
ncbi:hypothetical protein FOZ63_016417, partial [Perkinsus olseni]